MLPRTLTRFMALDGADRWLLARAYVDLGVCRMALRVVGFRRLLARVERRPASAVVREEDLRRAQRYGRWVNAAARYHPLRPRCLHRSLVLHSWLRRQGLPSALRIGVRTEAQTLSAHAWVELEDRVVNDRRRAVLDFSPLNGPRPASAALRTQVQNPDPEQWYRLYGLLVRSAVRLPYAALPPAEVAGQRPDWTICIGDEGACLPRPAQLGRQSDQMHTGHQDQQTDEADEEDGYVAHRDPDGTLWWWCPAAAFHALPAQRRIDVYPEAGADARSLGVVLIGPLAAFISCQMGYPALHASAVVLDGRVVAFLGTKGQGKSTMAAALLCRGAALLTDDLLQLRLGPGGAVYAMPGPPLLRAWPPTVAGALGLAPEALPDVSPATPKKLIALEGDAARARRLEASGQPAPVAALYLLDRCAAPSDGRAGLGSQGLLGREAIAALLSHISHGACLTAGEMTPTLGVLARLVRQTPVRRLRYPSGFDHQDAVCAHIAQEMGTTAAAVEAALAMGSARTACLPAAVEP